MPTVDKDAAMLAEAIVSVRENVWHPIGDIYVVAPPESERLQNICRRLGCTFVPEDRIIPLSKEDICYEYRGVSRNGWIYKMLLNLSADLVCGHRQILALDADTIFLAPQIFLWKGRPLFNLSDSYHRPYFKLNRRLLGERRRFSRSFVTHYMVFDAEVLRDLRQFLEERWKQPWYDVIIQHLDRTESSAFAEYELYGEFYTRHATPRPVFNYWSNKSMTIGYLSELSELKERYRVTHRSLSLHVYETYR